MGYLREYQIGVAPMIGSPHPAHDGITFCQWRSSALKPQIRRSDRQLRRQMTAFSAYRMVILRIWRFQGRSSAGFVGGAPVRLAA
jgi:hypothetical protein